MSTLLSGACAAPDTQPHPPPHLTELEEARAQVEHYEVLVRKLNDQMRRAMEKMDDQGDTLAMRAQRSEEVERKNGELEGENMYLTSQLITTKVELATSKGARSVAQPERGGCEGVLLLTRAARFPHLPGSCVHVIVSTRRPVSWISLTSD